MTNNTNSGYRVLDLETISAYLFGIPAVVDVLGLNERSGEKEGEKESEALDVVEIGDGNLNFVYRVSNASDASKSVIVKQAVPYLRMAGESWPLSQKRMLYEIRALQLYNEIAPNFVPDIYHADEEMSTLVMQCLGDHIILRRGMMDGIQYPVVAEHLGLFLAETLFKTSAWSMDSTRRRELMDKFTLNTELCQMSEEYIFTFPFMAHESNYSNPATDQWAKENIHTDYEFKKDVLFYKDLFVTKTESLLHGDLHSGSVMVNQKESYVIDMEFALFGPIGFDIGKVFSNFLLSCTSHYHRAGGTHYRQWILEQIRVIWNRFESRFLELWAQAKNSTMLVSGFFPDTQVAQFRSTYMQNLLQDSVGFAACSMVRRIFGPSGVADIRDIEDYKIRSALEISTLQLSKRLMKERKELRHIDDLFNVLKDSYSIPVL